jgi:hypothetical protein
MRTLSAVLSRAGGHEALLRLLELGDEVEVLRVTLARTWHRVGEGKGQLDEATCNEILQWIGEAYAIAFRLSTAFNVLAGGQSQPGKRFPKPVD